MSLSFVMESGTDEFDGTDALMDDPQTRKHDVTAGMSLYRLRRWLTGEGLFAEISYKLQ